MSAAALPIERPAALHSTESRRAEATRWIAGLHDELTSFFGRLDAGGTFIEDRWERPGGGGGVARVMTDGVTFENREDLLPPRQRGYYHEYTVPTPGSNDRGARRIVTGGDEEFYYSDDHYDSFRRIAR